MSSYNQSFNKESDYPPPDQWSGQKILEEAGYYFGLMSFWKYVCEMITGNYRGCVWGCLLCTVSAIENVHDSLSIIQARHKKK